MNKLINQLRNRYMDTKRMLPCELEHEAADALEAQAAQIEKMREQEPVAYKCNSGSLAYDKASFSPSQRTLPITPLYLHPAPIPDVEAKYNELLMAVGRVFKGESRHATALKYIRQMEEPSMLAAARSGE